MDDPDGRRARQRVAAGSGCRPRQHQTVGSVASCPSDPGGRYGSRSDDVRPTPDGILVLTGQLRYPSPEAGSLQPRMFDTVGQGIEASLQVLADRTERLGAARTRAQGRVRCTRSGTATQHRYSNAGAPGRCTGNGARM